MKKSSVIFAIFSLFLSTLQAEREEVLHSHDSSAPSFDQRSYQEEIDGNSKSSTVSSFSPFTGQVKKNKIRVRLHPSLESEIVQEASEGDLLIVTGEQGDFYQIKPTQNIKGYVYRTFVLDGQIEGNRVNVRLSPTTDSPVIMQLNAGDRVEGEVSKDNHRWVEITLPEAIRFYIAKEFVRNVGDPAYYSVMRARLSEVKEKLAKAYQESMETLRQDFPSMNPELVRMQFAELINDYPEFPEYSEKARKYLQAFEDKYLEKKVAYIESPQSQEEPKERAIPTYAEAVKQKPSVKEFQPLPQPHWQLLEEQLYQSWLEMHPDGTIDEFYADEAKNSTVLRGIIKAYNKNIKNKPGDYILVNQFDRPIAFLYSTKLDLQGLTGERVQLKVVERPNNHFAFPAYFVLSTE